MAPVELYVYDLSNGLAKTMSLPLTGKQIDGIWHTSVVVWGREVYYGQGIMESKPGRTHHGPPLHRLPMGETGLDEDTFNEYIDGLKDHYRADKYHLLSFNCNNFSDDVVAFLTAGAIPSWISSLPADFLSTPFGAALRPQIDAMFNPNSRPATPAGQPSSRSLPTPPPSSLLQNVIAQATAANSQPGAPAAAGSANTASLTSPLLLATSSASLHTILGSHRAVVAFFFAGGEDASRESERKFEAVAKARQGGIVAFVTVDTKVGRGQEVKDEWGVGRSVPPTTNGTPDSEHPPPPGSEGGTRTPVAGSFVFWLDGRKVDELDAPGDDLELESKIDGLIYRVNPPHKHSTLPLPLVQAILPSPILFTQIPAYPALLAKFGSFLPAHLPQTQITTLQAFLATQIVPFLETKQLPGGPSGNIDAFTETFTKWTEVLFGALPAEETFPLIDLWRVALLDPRIASSVALATSKGKPNPISLLLDLLLPSPTRSKHRVTDLPRPLLVTSTRFLSNTFASVPLATLVLSPTSNAGGASPRARLTSVLVEVLLHEDAGIRGAAAALAFNVAAVRHRKAGGVGRGTSREGEGDDGEEEGDWTLEVVIALVEAVRMEEKSEDVVQRLLSALGLLLYLSPYHSSTLGPNLEVIGAREIIEAKLEWVKRREVRGLVTEVGGRMCA